MPYGDRKIFIASGVIAGVSIAAFFSFMLSAERSFAEPVTPPTNPCEELTRQEGISKIGGYAWNNYLGWISHRDSRADVKDCGVQRITGSSGDEIVGWSWSPTYGWICWGSTCAAESIRKSTQTFKGCALTAQAISIDKTTSQLTGAGYVVSLCEKGKISMSGTLNGNAYTVKYDDTFKEFNGWAWNDSFGWIAFSGKTLWDTYLRPPCPSGTKSCLTSDGRVCKKECNKNKGAGDTRLDEVAECAANSCASERCDAVTKMCLANDGSSVESRYAEGRVCEPYCQESVSELNSGKERSKWKTTYLGARIQTRGGFVCSRQSVEQADLDTELSLPSGIGQCVGVHHVESVKGSDGKVRELKNEFGSLNIEALTSTGDGGERNKYGKQVVRVTAAPRDTSIPSCDYDQRKGDGSSLQTPEGKLYEYLSNSFGENEIYYYEGDLVIGDLFAPACGHEGWIIANGEKTGARVFSGAKTVVVKGSLTFKTPVIYERAHNLSDVRQLASVAWIVLKSENASGGGITIDNCAPPSPRSFDTPRVRYFTQIDGVLLAEGDIETNGGANCKAEFEKIPEELRKKTEDERKRSDELSQKGLFVESCSATAGTCRAACPSDGEKGSQCRAAVEKENEARSKQVAYQQILKTNKQKLEKDCRGGERVCSAECEKCELEKKNIKEQEILPAQTLMSERRSEANKLASSMFRDCAGEYSACPTDNYFACEKKKNCNAALTSEQRAACVNYSQCLSAQTSYRRANRYEETANRYKILESQFSQDIPVRLNGVAIARRFIFRRSYAGVDSGSEVIQNDGRYIVNTPPGLEDFSRGLPAW